MFLISFLLMQVIIGSPNSTACFDNTIYMFAASGEMKANWDYFVPKHNKARKKMFVTAIVIF